MKDIIQKYLEGSSTDEEQKELLKWLRVKENNLLFQNYKLEWKSTLKEIDLQGGNLEAWQNMQNRLFSESYGVWKRSIRFQTFFKYAAIFLFLFSLGSVLYLMSGKNTRPVEFSTSIIADNGQISRIILPDSSIVWLNSGSKLSYTNRYAVEDRNIRLNGEAWFKVKRNEDLPMVINCSGLFVKVLGTSFNVSAYSGFNKMDVVLERGSVELYESLESKQIFTLKPGEKAEYNRNKKTMTISQVNTKRYASWKEGMINFYNNPLEDIVLKLEKRYNQHFSMDEQIKNIPLTFTIKNETLEAVIKLIERIAPVSAVQVKDEIRIEYNKNKAERMKKMGMR